MLLPVALVRTGISEEHNAYILVTVNVVPSSPTDTIMMEAIPSCETSAFTRATCRNFPEDGILHSHRRGNLKSYIMLTGWAL
jgi:hypothetical protein